MTNTRPTPREVCGNCDMGEADVDDFDAGETGAEARGRHRR
jgi:hypothetical protein